MSKAKITDILILALISGVVAILTSTMGISGTIIGAVVTSLIGELLKTYFKDPIVSEIKQDNIKIPKRTQRNRVKQTNYNYTVPKQRNKDSSYISTKILFIFPLVIILIIEIIHFLGAAGVIPYDIFLNLENITNWRLFRTIGYALIVMGLYPIISKKIKSSYGILLIIIGIIELVIGYADVNVQASMIYSLFESIKEYINIVIIAGILYTVLTVTDDMDDNKNKNKNKFKPTKSRSHRFNNNQYDKDYDDENIYYYEE